MSTISRIRTTEWTVSAGLQAPVPQSDSIARSHPLRTRDECVRRIRTSQPRRRLAARPAITRSPPLTVYPSSLTRSTNCKMQRTAPPPQPSVSHDTVARSPATAVALSRPAYALRGRRNAGSSAACRSQAQYVQQRYCTRR